jgi:drug/metabolite transporter (DMT)-like permease
MTGYLFAALTGFLFGFQGAYGRFVANKFPSAFLTWASFAFAVPLVITLLFVRGIPTIDGFNFAWATATSFILNTVAWNLFFRALAASPLYLTMPFTAFTPIFLIPIAFAILGELPERQGFLGIILIIAGAYIIHLRAGNLFQPLVNILREKGTRYMLVVAFIWSISATVDKVAVLSSSPEFYGVTIYLLLAGVYSPYIYWHHRELLKGIVVHLKNLIFLGALSGGVVIFQFLALQYLEVSYVIAFKRAGIIFSVLSGYFFFGEKNIVKNSLATAMIISGAILIIL